MNDVLVSVIVPVYNVERYLDRCVSSIVDQSYDNLEIILVDDGSTDTSPELCDAWAERDHRIRVFHKENGGAGLARNVGLSVASGGYVYFVDSDDYIAREAVEKHLCMAKETGAEIVVSGAHNVAKDGCTITTVIPSAKQLYFAGEEVQTDFLPALVDNRHNSAAVKGLTLSLWSAFFSMELIRRANWQIVSERQYYSEDSYSLIKLYANVAAVAILQQACYFYCENKTSLSHTYREGQYAAIKQFYSDCHALAQELNYCNQVHQSVSALCLGFSIATMKQIAAANMAGKEKKKLLRQLLRDDILQQALADIAGRTYGKARTVLFWTMRHRQCCLCYLLLVLQNIADRK